MRNPLWYLYQPYKWLVLGPAIVLSTVVFGFLALILLVFMKPKFPSRFCGTLWARINAWVTPMWVTVTGRENMDRRKSYVIVSNHQSQYDIFVLYGWLGVDFKWIMKKELRKVPVIGLACDKLGHIFIDRSDRKAALATIQQAKSKIRGGTSVLFFPEGTRSRSLRMLPFKKGAFKMALDLDLPILPITIVGTRDVLPPDSIDIFPGKAEMIIHEPVAIHGYNDDNIKQLMEKIRNIIQEPLTEAQGQPGAVTRFSRDDRRRL
ncbi:MAG: lysophospholipid acyltransferase family protein [Thermodesulfobacteriota bacterium]